MEVPLVLIPVAPFRIKLLCPECAGALQYTEMTLDSYPPQYVHRCKDCGRQVNAPKRTGEIQYLDPVQQGKVDEANQPQIEITEARPIEGDSNGG